MWDDGIAKFWEVWNREYYMREAGPEDSTHAALVAFIRKVRDGE